METLTTQNDETLKDSSGSTLSAVNTFYILVNSEGKVLKNSSGNLLYKGTIETYNITATTINLTASSSNPTIILGGGTATLTFNATGDYIVPTSLPTITGADGTYNRVSDTECTITLSNASSDVSFTIEGVVASYTITPTLLNVTADSSNPTSIKPNEEKTLVYTSNSGYTLPTSLTVSGATISSWTIKNIYEISATSTNCFFDESLSQTTYTNTCDDTGTLTINIYADGTTYSVPTTIEVTSGTYTKESNSHATLVITKPTEDVAFTSTGLTTTSAPENLSASGTTLTFDPVDGATSYEVYAKDSSGTETDLGEYTPA